MASKFNFDIDAGTDFSLDINVDNETVVNLADFTATAKLIKHYLADANSAISFTCSVNASASIVTLSMNHVQTANITPGRYMYDVKLTSSGNSVLRLVEGMITVNPKVT